jgi:membrane protein YdbS with pleckstrin-like domain
VVAADPDAEAPWLATEYVPGPSLQQAVSGHGPLPVPAVRVVGARLAEALSAIHSAGLVHRDLKPANVLLPPEGPKVIDFGIARAFLTDTAGMTAAIGTPSYMAPEQVRGEPLSPASDVFSLGSTLVYALRGRGPFSTGEPAGIIFRVAIGDPDLAEVPRELHGVIAACLAKEPGQRPTTGQLLAELGPRAGAVVTPYGGWRPPAHDPAAALTGAAPEASPSPPPSPSPSPSPPPAPVATKLYVGQSARATQTGSRVARHLRPDERHCGEWRHHPVHALFPAAAGVGATLLLWLLAAFAVIYMKAGWFATIALLIWVVVAAWAAWQAVERSRGRLILTDQRLLLVGGLVRTRVATVPLSRITDLRYTQSALGRMLNYATLAVAAPGAAPVWAAVPHLPNPTELYQRIADERHLLAASESRAGPR